MTQEPIDVKTDKAPAMEWKAWKIPYDADFVREIKFYVPAHSRAWDAQRKEWLVSPQYTRVVEILVARSFDERHGLNWYASWGYLCLAPNAPQALIKASVDILHDLTPDKHNEIETARILIDTYGKPNDIMIPPTQPE